MATFQCRVQFLDDTDPFNANSIPEPTRPPTYTFLKNVILNNQIGGVRKLLKAPHRVRKNILYYRSLSKAVLKCIF